MHAEREEHMTPGDQAPQGTDAAGENVCPDCEGTGRRGGDECPTCEGSGRIVEGIGGG
jgi:DnaJ-class molecular chaperone